MYLINYNTHQGYHRGFCVQRCTYVPSRLKIITPNRIQIKLNFTVSCRNRTFFYFVSRTTISYHCTCGGLWFYPSHPQLVKCNHLSFTCDKKGRKKNPDDKPFIYSSSKSSCGCLIYHLTVIAL